MKMNFVCEECGCNKIEEISGDVVVTSVLKNEATYLGGGEIEFQYAESENGGEPTVYRYQCEKCGDIIADSTHELIEYLVEKNMVEFDENDEEFEEE